MKRKLVAKAAEFDRRARNRQALDNDGEEGPRDAKLLSEWDKGAHSDDDDEASRSEEDSESDTNEAGNDEAGADDADKVEKRVKGVLSAKDAALLKARKAETSRIENIVPYRNKQRTLVFCSRGVTSRFRHLMEDMRALLPHHKKDVKHDTKKNLHEINALCDVKACNNCIFFEARKSKDLYMWLSKTPNGPSVKFHVLNIHTMDELRLSGNCLKGSRPLLSFSSEFGASPALMLVKELFTQIYGTPRGHPKSKPFVDHVMSFSVLDGKIWFRHFQITDATADAREIKQALKRGEEPTKLVEIGPRFVLNLIKIFEDSFGGRSLATNPEYTTPNQQRSELLRSKGAAYASRKRQEQNYEDRLKHNVMPDDPIQNVFK